MATPWNKIRAEWLKGGITQKKLAEKYGLSVKTIQNRAYKDGWKKEKGKIREKVEEQTRERVTRARVNHLEKLIEANEALLEGLVELTELIKKNPFQMFNDANGTLRNAESVAKAIQTATMTQRDLYGLKNIDQKFAQKKWRDQVKMEKEKAMTDTAEQELIRIHEPEGVETDG